jgi:hypothetical protein
MNHHKESKIERYTEKRSLLRRLLESEAEAQTEIANKIFSKIAELLVAGDLETKIVSFSEFLKLSGGESIKEENPQKSAPEPCAFLEPSEEGIEGKYTAYIPEEYPADQRAKAVIHEALHVLFDQEDDTSEDNLELSDSHEKIYLAEDIIWGILTDESKKWLQKFVALKKKRLPK